MRIARGWGVVIGLWRSGMMLLRKLWAASDGLERTLKSKSKFDALLSDPENQYWFQLTPGRLLSM